MLFHINYADKNFTNSQKLNTSSAKKFNYFDYYLNYSPSDIKPSFVEKNRKILSNPKGGGYWLWKSYFILETLKKANKDDVIFYTDSGSLFINHPKPLVDLIYNNNQDVIPFALSFQEKTYTKRDAFILMNCDDIKYYDTKHNLASFIIAKKSDYSLDFFEQFLNYSCDERIISDIDNTLGLPNYDGFKEHRHDQSIFSLLSKKYSLQVFRDPSQWGNSFIDDFKNSPYPQIIDSTRQKNKNFNYFFHKFTKFYKKIFYN